MASLVAMARMSAHDTLFRHCGTASTAALALMTVSKPSPARDRLLGWSFSAVLFPADATIADARGGLPNLPRHDAANDGLHAGAHAGVVVAPEWLRRARRGAARRGQRQRHHERRRKPPHAAGAAHTARPALACSWCAWCLLSSSPMKNDVQQLYMYAVV